MFYGKLVAGALGFLLMGPVGLAGGLLAGHFFDRGIQRSLHLADPTYQAQLRQVFFETCFQLLGRLAKADGRVHEAEIEHTEEVMRHLEVSPEQRQEAIALFRKGADPSLDIDAVLANFNDVCQQQRPVQHTLLVFLISLALADHVLDQAEIETLEYIAPRLGVNVGELRHLVRMMQAQQSFQQGSQREGAPRAQVTVDEMTEAYLALGVDPDCSDRDLKRAYRKRMSENHPDKLIARGVPEQMIKLATERSQEIQAAYDLLKNSRKK